MRKIIGKIFLFLCLLGCIGVFTSCRPGETLPEFPTDIEIPEEDQREAIYKMAVASGYTGTYEEWLDSIKGEAVQLSVKDGYLVWKYATSTTWTNLLDLADLKGADGEDGKDGVTPHIGENGNWWIGEIDTNVKAEGTNGADGEDGKTPEFRVYEGYLQWKYVSEDDTKWQNLYPVASTDDEESKPTEKNETITITFVTKWEENPEATGYEDYFIILEYTEIEIEKGLIEEPIDLVPEGYETIGWFVHDKYEEDYIQWKFDFYYAGKDLVLFGVFGEIYEITFLDEEGNYWYKETVNSENPYIDSYVNYTPKNPEETFLGWTVDGKDYLTPENLFVYKFTESTTFKPYLTKGKEIELTFSGGPNEQDIYLELFEYFKQVMRESGDANTYIINYETHGPDVIDSEILDWSFGPDVYNFSSDKLANLYNKGALARIVGENKKFIEENITEMGQDLVTFDDSYYGYPYTTHNTYFLQYDKSVFGEESVKDIFDLLDTAHEKGLKVGYCLGTSFWGAGLTFTFGADYQIHYTEDGIIDRITADFNSEKGMSAAKIYYEIVNHPAFIDYAGVPTPGEGIAAVIGGIWDVKGYQKLWNDNYGCSVMPSVTVDGETKNLGAFLGGEIFGVNPLRSALDSDADRLAAAHKLARFLSSEESQIKLYEYFSNKADEYTYKTIVPTNIQALDKIKEYSQVVNVISQQAEFAHPQKQVPEGMWIAPSELFMAIKEGECTLDNLQQYMNKFNATVCGEEYNEEDSEELITVTFVTKWEENPEATGMEDIAIWVEYDQVSLPKGLIPTPNYEIPEGYEVYGWFYYNKDVCEDEYIMWDFEKDTAESDIVLLIGLDLIPEEPTYPMYNQEYYEDGCLFSESVTYAPDEEGKQFIETIQYYHDNIIMRKSETVRFVAEIDSTFTRYLVLESKTWEYNEEGLLSGYSYEENEIDYEIMRIIKSTQTWYDETEINVIRKEIHETDWQEDNSYYSKSKVYLANDILIEDHYSYCINQTNMYGYYWIYSTYYTSEGKFEYKCYHKRDYLDGIEEEKYYYDEETVKTHIINYPKDENHNYNSLRMEYYLNGQVKMKSESEIKCLYFTPESASYVGGLVKTWEYDEEGNLLTYTVDANEIDMERQVVLTSSQTVYGSNGIDVIEYSNSSYNYDSNNMQESSLTQKFNGNDILIENIKVKYTENNNLSYIIVTNYNDEGKFLSKQKTENLYKDGELNKIIYTDYDENDNVLNVREDIINQE